MTEGIHCQLFAPAAFQRNDIMQLLKVCLQRWVKACACAAHACSWRERAQLGLEAS